MSVVKDSPAVTIRQPATANLMIDSADRNVGASANDFSITRSQALLNGFFTRIATTELVLEWGVPNFSLAFGNTTVLIDISGAGAVTGTGQFSADLSGGGFLTVEDWAATTEVLLNAAGALTTPATTWTLANPRPGFVTFTPNQEVYIWLQQNSPFNGWFNFGRLVTPTWVLIDPAGVDGVAEELSIGGGKPGFTSPQGFLNPPSPTMDLRAIRYLDFVSAQLTYNQDLKDSSTNISTQNAPLSVVRDVLARWYMAYDNQSARVDGYGFPIYMGYEAFVLRRLFNPPKQIRWENIQPVGNISFQVYTDTGMLAPMTYSNWLMTLQVSED